MADATLFEPTQTGRKPVKVFRIRGLSASIFPNQAKVRNREVIFHKVSLQRTYKDGDQFKTTTGLGRDDLPIAQLLLRQAWEWILDLEAKRRQSRE